MHDKFDRQAKASIPFSKDPCYIKTKHETCMICQTTLLQKNGLLV